MTQGIKKRLVARHGICAPGSGPANCFYCGAEFMVIWNENGRVYLMGLEVDHLVPVIRGGANDDGNLVLSCQPCNLRKGTSTLQEFLASA